MKKKILFIIISVLIVVSFAIGFSYAYFSVRIIGNEIAGSNQMNSKSLVIDYEGLDYISLDNAEPGDTESFVFSVKNAGSVELEEYDIYFSNLINTFINDEIVYEVTCSSSDYLGCDSKASSPIPGSGSLMHSGSLIRPRTTHTYTVEITFIDTGLNQDYNQEKELYFTLTVSELFEYQTLIARSTTTSTELFWEYSASITNVTFENEINIPVGAVESWDVSSDSDGSVMAYVIDDGLGTSTYKLFIQTDGDFIYANPNSAGLFQSFTVLTSINNIDLLDTSKVTKTNVMFAYSSALTSLDLSSFDVSKVVNMNGMMYHCSGLTSLILGNFNSISATDMSSMFSWCNSLITLDLSNFDTSNVINMSCMFFECSKLNNINLSTFDTSNVTDMRSMFHNCETMTTIDLSTFDTSNVTDMSSLFQECSGLTSVNLTGINTTKVTTFLQMFAMCSDLTSLDLSDFDCPLATNMNYMFYGCTNLNSLTFDNFNTTSLITMEGMFAMCSTLTSLDLSSFNTSNVTNMASSFQQCTNLASINLSSFNTANVTTMYQMFALCPYLTSLDLGSFNTSKVTNMSAMFYGCTRLNYLNFKAADFTTVTQYSSYFYNITSGITVIVKDTNAQTWITNRLSNSGKTGTVTIYVP